jgi:predicted dehydrogenase
VIADFRRALDDKNVDALAIAAPDHWHTPMTLLALKAGKHVYLEKPSGHDPHEDELLIAASSKYDKHVQLGTQRRSGPRFFEAIQAMKDGAIGKPYLARAWYANTRTTIGKGKEVPVPPELDYELWQGPARTPYRDNVVHYNWHWFKQWGTGEICNNGTHEIDVARWLLGVDYPTTVISYGHRNHFADDWEFPDTQDAMFEFADGKTIVWHGQSCNGLPMYDRGRGTMLLGTEGSLIIDQDGWVLADLRNKVIKESTATEKGDARTRRAMIFYRAHMKNSSTPFAPARSSTPRSRMARKRRCHTRHHRASDGSQAQRRSGDGSHSGDKDAMTRWSRISRRAPSVRSRCAPPTTSTRFRSRRCPSRPCRGRRTRYASHGLACPSPWARCRSERSSRRNRPSSAAR